MKDARIPTYVSRSKSYFYDSAIRLKTLDAFYLFGRYSRSAANEWLDRLESLSVEQIFEIVARVPDELMGNTEKLFCNGVIIANKARILNLRELLQPTVQQEDKGINP